jgi:general stress protein 26
MRQIEISYKELEQDFIEELSKLGSEGLYNRGILATTKGDHVTARRMRLVSKGLTLYFITDRGSRKCIQIMANPKVAVVAGFMQIEGVASLKGHPFDEPVFLEAYQESQSDNYEQWRAGQYVTRERDMVLIEVIPERISLFRYADPESGIERGNYVLNASKKKAHRIIDMISMQSDPSGAPAYRE